MDDVTVGVLGLRRGMTHLRNYLAIEGSRAIGAADRYPGLRAKAEELMAPTGGKVVSEFDELLEMGPDLVVVASNGRAQADHACQALEAGCHVVAEVPGAYTVEEVIRLRDTVERTGRTYMLAENLCFMDFIRYWRKWYVEGRFGFLSLAEAEYLHYLPNSLVAPDGSRLKPTEARGRTDVRPLWRADQPPIQYLTHDLGPLLEILDDRCVNVNCRSGPWRCPEAPLRPDGQFALFETAKGSLIRILVTLNTRMPGGHRFRMMGVEGSVEWFTYEGFCRRLDKDREERAGWERIDIGMAAPDTDTSSGHGGADGCLARHLIRCLREGEPPPLDVYRMAEITLPGIIAARSAELGGVPLPIPDLRRNAYPGTQLWNTVGLPDAEPESRPYRD